MSFPMFFKGYSLLLNLFVNGVVIFDKSSTNIQDRFVDGSKIYKN